MTATSLRVANKKSNLGVRPKGYWQDVKNWRKFFHKMAEGMGHDPMLPETWPPFSKKAIVEAVRYLR